MAEGNFEFSYRALTGRALLAFVGQGRNGNPCRFWPNNTVSQLAMKRVLAAFALSYLATLITLVAIAYSSHHGGELVGIVYLRQELAVPDYSAGEYRNLKSSLPFFWGELGQTKAVYAKVRQHSEYVPFFYLTTQPKHGSFNKGLFVEVYDYDWGNQGEIFNKRLKDFFPIARDEIIAALQTKGIVAAAKGEMVMNEDRSRTPLRNLLFGGFLFIPAFLITMFILPKNWANKAPEPMSTTVTPPADAGDRASGAPGSS
jgi:hypothetical protein